MAKKTVIPLEIDLSADLKDFEFLRKELKQISKETKLADTSFDGLISGIKQFGKETQNTTNGIKGQIAAFDKLRDRIDFQGKAYKEVTSEIIQLNKALANRISLEKEIGAAQSSGRGRRAAQRGDSSVLGQGILGLYGEQDFRKQQVALQSLLSRGPGSATADQLKFLTETTFNKRGEYKLQDFSGTPKFQKQLRESNAAYRAAELRQKGSGKHKINIEQLTRVGAELNAVQREALGIRDTGNIRSEAYADVLQEIIAREQSWTQIKKAQNTVADNANAKLKAQQFIQEKNIKLQRDRAKSFLFQKETQEWEQAKARDSISAGKGKTSRAFSRFAVRPNIEELRNWQQQPFIQRFFESFAATQLGPDFQSPSWKKMFSEQSEKANPLGIFDRKTYQGGRQRIRDYIPRTAGGIGSFDPSKTRLNQIMKSKDLGFGKGILQPLDPFKLGARQPAPKTDIGLGDELAELQSLLPNLVRGSKEWVAIKDLIIEKQKEIADSVKRGNDVLDARKKKIAEAVNPRVNQKLLPAAGETVGSKREREAFLAGKDTGFGADQYGPQQSWMQKASESQKQFVKRLEESVKAGKLNINTLGKQRSKLDEVRNSLDPTSAAFKRATVAIAKTDKALAKLNNNKFSGRNIGRTAQSILGASFFGGPAGFLGSTLGAGVEALRPGGDMAQGAVTGGLVASQVLQPIAGFGAESANYTAMIEKSKIALEAATKVEGDAIASKEAYAIALGTAASVTERFNVPQELAARGMTRLSAAVIGAGGNIHNAGIAFENISAAIKATGGSTEDTKAAVTAMVQIFSKGKVSAEELSGQLGERFPAAVTLFAEANNMTTKELQKGLKDGAIGLDKLWNFVLKLGDKYVDVAEKIGSASVEAGVRSKIAWNEVKLAVGTALQPIGADLQVIGAEILTGLVPALTKLAEITGSVLKTVSGALVVITEHLGKVTIVLGTFITALGIANGQALVAFANALVIVPFTAFIKNLGLAKITMQAFGAAAAATTGKMVILNTAMQTNIFVLAATAIAGAGVAAWHFGRQWQRTVDEIEKGKMPLEDARIKVAALEKELQGESNEETRQRLQTQIQIYKEAIETRIELVNKAKEAEAKAFENSTPKTDRWEDLRKYMTQMKEDSLNLQKVFINAFEAMEESLVKFVKTGKLTFKELANSIIDDLARMIIQQIRYNILAGIMKGLDGGGGIGGFISGLFGGGGGGPAPVNSATLGANATQMTGIPTKPSAGSFGISGAETGRDPGRHDPTFGTGIPSGADLPAGSFGITPVRDPYEGISTMAKGGIFGKNGIVPFYKGGIVDRPTLFPFAKGVGLMGEAGPEAIVPLKRGKDGKLGIAGGGGGNITNNIVVNVKTEPGSGSGKTDVKAASSQLSMFGKAISVAVQQELVKQSRPGGLLTRG